MHLSSWFYPLERPFVTHCRGGWVGPRAGLEGYVEGNNLLPPPWFESQIVKPMASHYTNWAILTLCDKKNEKWKTISLIEILATYYSSITNKMQRYTMTFIIVNVLHVSGGSSAHHQVLKTAYTTTGNCRAFPASYRYCEWVPTQEKLNNYPLLCMQFWAPDDGRRNCLKHAEHLW
jgi:hypothetical protein